MQSKLLRPCLIGEEEQEMMQPRLPPPRCSGGRPAPLRTLSPLRLCRLAGWRPPGTPESSSSVVGLLRSALKRRGSTEKGFQEVLPSTENQKREVKEFVVNCGLGDFEFDVCPYPRKRYKKWKPKRKQRDAALGVSYL